MNHDRTRHPDNRARGAERRSLVSSLHNQGQSLRQIARELGWDEGTIRRDLRILQLPAPQLKPIIGGDSAEQYLRAARLAVKAREEQAKADEEERHRRALLAEQERHRLALVNAERGRRMAEEKATGCHSDALKKHVLSWLKLKRLDPDEEQFILKAPEMSSWNSGDRDELARQDVARVFADCQYHLGYLPKDRCSLVNFYGDVLNGALMHLAPEREIRKETLRKAMAEIMKSNVTFQPPRR